MHVIRWSTVRPALALALLGTAALVVPSGLPAQAPMPTMLDRNLAVRTAASGLAVPVSLAFIGADDMLVLEKNSGRVQRVTGGTLQGPVLDLAVNFASERGLLGIALDPGFPANPGVYLYWTCQAPPPPPENPYFPTATDCSETAMLGADTNVTLAVPLLTTGWTGSCGPAARSSSTTTSSPSAPSSTMAPPLLPARVTAPRIPPGTTTAG